MEFYWNWCNIRLSKLFTRIIHKNAASSVKFSEDMESMLSVGQDAMLKVYCLLTQKQIRSVVVQGFPVKLNDIIVPSTYPSTALIGTNNGFVLV